jgi:hypothetical protein
VGATAAIASQKKEGRASAPGARLSHVRSFLLNDSTLPLDSGLPNFPDRMSKIGSIVWIARLRELSLPRKILFPVACNTEIAGGGLDLVNFYFSSPWLVRSETVDCN